jgi:cytochrome c biogenesis protein CcmG/thiol:disulfide interchange protein DsbE
MTDLTRRCIHAVGLAILAGATLDAEFIRNEVKRKRAPEFELKNASGSTMKMSDYKGKVVLIDFWATWCVPCRTEIPWFIEFAEKYKEDGLMVLGISMDKDGWPVITPYLETMKVNYPVVLGSKRVAYLYGDIDALPVTLLIDRSQRVAGIHVGLAKKKEIEDQIKRLLSQDAK